MERVLPTKASKAEVNAGLSLKANVADVSRTIAEVASTCESKLSFEEVQNLLDDKVSKADLQYLLSNKVSIEELNKVLDHKASAHEVNLELSSLQNKIDELHRDLTKRVQTCALQKDLAYLSTVLETKASVDDMNEALQSKANKQSVANALHRKANRTDVDQLLEGKADASDLEKICNLLEGKADATAIDQLAKVADAKLDKSELAALRHELGQKSERADVDLYVRAVQSQRNEFEARQVQIEREFDGLVNTLQKELESLKATTMLSLSKKADFTLVESIRDSMLKKVDHDYLQTASQKIKAECQSLISTYQTETTLIRKQRDDKLDDRITKTETL